MFIHLQSKSSHQNAGDLIINLDDIITLDIVKQTINSKIIYAIQYKLSISTATETFDSEQEARDRLQFILKLLDSSHINANDYQIEDMDNYKNNMPSFEQFKNEVLKGLIGEEKEVINH